MQCSSFVKGGFQTTVGLLPWSYIWPAMVKVETHAAYSLLGNTAAAKHHYTTSFLRSFCFSSTLSSLPAGGCVCVCVCVIYKNKKQYCKLYTYSITAVWCCQMSLWLFLSLKNVTPPSTTEYFISISWDRPWVCPRTWKMILTPGWAILCFVGTADESGLLVKGLWMSIHTHRLMCQWGREDDTLSPSRVQVYDHSLRKPLIQVRGGSR